MKKIISVAVMLMIFVSVLSLTGCGKEFNFDEFNFIDTFFGDSPKTLEDLDKGMEKHYLKCQEYLEKAEKAGTQSEKEKYTALAEKENYRASAYFLTKMASEANGGELIDAEKFLLSEIDRLESELEAALEAAQTEEEKKELEWDIKENEQFLEFYRKCITEGGLRLNIKD